MRMTYPDNKRLLSHSFIYWCDLVRQQPLKSDV